MRHAGVSNRNFEEGTYDSPVGLTLAVRLLTGRTGFGRRFRHGGGGREGGPGVDRMALVR